MVDVNAFFPPSSKVIHSSCSTNSGSISGNPSIMPSAHGQTEHIPGQSPPIGQGYLNWSMLNSIYRPQMITPDDPVIHSPPSIGSAAHGNGGYGASSHDQNKRGESSSNGPYSANPKSPETGAESSSEAETRRPHKTCRVCNDHATGYNFNVITCESCKAFFRRNALRPKEFKCPYSDDCAINSVSRRFCQKCRLRKCFAVGMKKEWILNDEQLRRRKNSRLNSLGSQQRKSSIPPQQSPPSISNMHLGTQSAAIELVRQQQALAKSMAGSSTLEPKPLRLFINNPRNSNSTTTPSPLLTPPTHSYQMLSPTNSFSTDSSLLSRVSSIEKATPDSVSSCDISPHLQKIRLASNSSTPSIQTPTTPVEIGDTVMLSKDEYRHLLSQIPRNCGIDPLAKRNSISIDPLQQQTSPSMTNSVEMHSPTGMPTSSLMTPQTQTQQLPSVLPSSPDYSLTGINISPERFKNYTELGCYNNQTDAIMQSPPNDTLTQLTGRSQGPANPIQPGNSFEQSFNPRIEHNIMTELVIPVEEAYQTKLDHLHREAYIRHGEMLRDQKEALEHHLTMVNLDRGFLSDTTKPLTEAGVQANPESSTKTPEEKIFIGTYQNMSLDDTMKLNAMESAFLDMEEEDVDDSKQSLESLQKKEKNANDVLNIMDITMRRIVKMTKRLPGFNNISQDGKYTILKGNMTELLTVRGLTRYNPYLRGWVAKTATTVTTIPFDMFDMLNGKVNESQKQKTMKFFMLFTEELRNDRILTNLLLVLALFNYMKHYDKLVQQDHYMLEFWRNKYWTLLEAYLKSEYETRMNQIFAIMKEATMQLVDISLQCGDLFRGIINPKKVEPLPLEIYNLTDEKVPEDEQ